jgi:menaquinone-dependent protoporphyrinogen oxidase
VESLLTRVLVAYATRFGSTREIAAAIVHELNSAELDAHAAEATGALNPSDYDAFVIGSPLYGGKWLSQAGMFAAITSERIDGKPVALFSIGTLGISNQEGGNAEHAEYVRNLKEVAPKLNVVSDALFSGYFERANLPWYLRIIDRFAPTPQGDHRDWVAIQSWANSLTSEFGAE